MAQDHRPNHEQTSVSSEIDLDTPPTNEFLREADEAARTLMNISANAGQYFGFEVNIPQEPQQSSKSHQALDFPKDEVRWHGPANVDSYNSWRYEKQPAHSGLLELRVANPDFSDVETILTVRTHTFSDRKVSVESQWFRAQHPTALTELLATSGQGISLEIEDKETRRHYYFLSEPEREEVTSEFPEAPCSDVIVTSSIDALPEENRNNRDDLRARPIQRPDTQELTGLRQKVEDYILRHAALREYKEDLLRQGLSTRPERDQALEFWSQEPQEKPRGVANALFKTIGLRAPSQRKYETFEEKRQTALAAITEKQILEDTPLPFELTWDGWRQTHDTDDPSTRHEQIEAIRLSGEEARSDGAFHY
jgi:hypothetical protein